MGRLNHFGVVPDSDEAGEMGKSYEEGTLPVFQGLNEVMGGFRGKVQALGGYISRNLRNVPLQTRTMPQFRATCKPGGRK